MDAMLDGRRYLFNRECLHTDDRHWRFKFFSVEILIRKKVSSNRISCRFAGENLANVGNAEIKLRILFYTKIFNKYRQIEMMHGELEK
ncbi:hypothetical protein T06_6079 [Trichinella sp. T6]|nr:hypothetical protein T06_6079 [Trichinella sp. T6]